MAESRVLACATLFYPDGAPFDEERVTAQNVAWYLSPMHDKDVYEKGEQKGELKKIHQHCLFIFPSLKSRKQCEELIKAVGGVGCEMVSSPTKYARYLCHLDNKKKVQYNPDDVIQDCGGKPYKVLIKTGEDKEADDVASLKGLITKYRDMCEEFGYKLDFEDFILNLLEEELNEYVIYIQKNCYFIKQILKI